MYRFLRDNFAELFITFLTLLSGFVFFTLVSDDYGGFTYYSLSARQFSDYAYIDYYYLGLIGISYVLAFLYTHLPAWNWFGISFLFFNFLALFLILRTIRMVVFKDGSNPWVIRAIQVLVAVFFLENFISISHTRFSLPLCGIGLFNLLFRQSLSRGKMLIYILVFLLGMLIRPESSMGMILLVSGGYLIYHFDLLHLIRRVIGPAILTALLFGSFAYDWEHTDVFVKRVEPEIEYKMMARRVVDLGTMKTPEDSIKYQAARNGLWFDYKVLTPEYLRSIQLSTFDLNPQLKTDQKLARPHSWHPGIDLGMQHVIDVFLHVATFYHDYAFIPALIFGLIILGLLKKENRKWALRITLFAIYTFVLIYIIDYNAFMVGERHLIGIQLVSLTIMLFYFFHHVNVADHPRMVLIIFFSWLVAGEIFTLAYYKRSNNGSASELAYHQKSMKKIESIYQNRLIVVTNENYYLFDPTFSLRNHIYTGNRYIMFDVFTYSLTPKYLDYLHRECHCDPSDPIAFYRWLSDEHALYVSKKKRLGLTEKYMQIIHHQNLQFPFPEKYDQLIAGEDTTNPDYLLRSVVVSK
jgi:hypothetical protein